MAAGKSNTRSLRGMSLVSVMIALTVVSVAAIGTSRLRYYAALDSRKAAMSIAAARIAELFCESWRAIQGVETYDPVASLTPDLALEKHSTVAPLPSEGGFTQLGGYKLVLNNETFYATLSWKELSEGLRALNTAVAWAPQGQGNADSVLQVTVYTTTP